MSKVVVGTRGSQLALRQTEEVLARLKRLDRDLSLEVVEIKSAGDAAPETPLERLGKGVFISELELALLQGRIDMAVHSLKDLPVELAEGLALAVVCQREDPRDALVSKTGCAFSEMPPGAVIGTSSPRRAAQLRAMRGDLRVEPIRGNVETRLRKALGPDYDGVVVAVAGLARLGLEGRISHYFDPFEMVPEPGQGALAVEIRAEDRELLHLVSQLEDPPTRIAVTAERAFVERLGGGCRVPMAAYGAVKGNTLKLVGMVISEDGKRAIKAQLEHPQEEPRAAGLALAERLLSLGAADVLKVETWS
ncbi:MAG: hemC [Dehalococcoidia bacterium]|nr:hemC [Dehalococcoidia bacterium]